eukprot:115424-Chlamydomonas_euryale.AAC.1
MAGRCLTKYLQTPMPSLCKLSKPKACKLLPCAVSFPANTTSAPMTGCIECAASKAADSFMSGSADARRSKSLCRVSVRGCCGARVMSSSLSLGTRQASQGMGGCAESFTPDTSAISGQSTGEH